MFTPGGSDDFYQETEGYWGSGAGANGIASGPLTAPATGNATAPGQTTFHHGAFAYPDTYDTQFNGQNRWVDVEVTPAAESPPPSSPPPAGSSTSSGGSLRSSPSAGAPVSGASR